ncbi:hypothetical protein [Paenibacillus koleovorans]|uniref:hypothetical protein n=1 Tax=Paenibacillus koleovorans TaxID=121608 RepID=UPI000FDC01CB|nr:hypothetical protein [Paenibacillus koleovorans]
MEAQSAKVIKGYGYNGSRSNLANINAYSAALNHWGSVHPYTPWLYGAIGIPFMFRVVEELNIAPVLYELPHNRIVGLLNNLGVRVEGMSEVAHGKELNKLRDNAWDAVRIAVDAGYTCFGQGFSLFTAKQAWSRGTMKRNQPIGCLSCARVPWMVGISPTIRTNGIHE